jgi:DNA-binding IclR family transcriptional regulator
MSEWGFLTNHARALLCITRDPDARLRDVSDCLGITERAAHRIVGDLVEGGYLSRRRVGRRNVYEVHPELTLRGSVKRDHDVGEVLEVLLAGRGRAA